MGTKCDSLLYAGNSCDRPTWSNVYGETDGTKCVFHSKQYIEKRGAFESELKKYIADVEANNSVQAYDFSNFIFPSLELRQKMFTKSAVFFQAQFHGPVDLTEATFEQDATFTSARFISTAIFQDTVFKGDAGFSHAQFLEFSSFIDTAQGKECKFRANADFSNSHFSSVQFNRAVFLGEADFNLTKFNGLANFSEVVFRGKSEFLDAEFSDEAYFISTEFHANSCFRMAKFHSRAQFARNVKFLGELDLKAITVNRELIFTEAVFENVVSFKNSRLFGKMILEKCNFKKSHLLDFRDIFIEREGKLHIFEADLTKAIFLQTDLTNVDFDNIDWDAAQIAFGARHKLHDEKLTFDDKLLKRTNQTLGDSNEYGINIASLENLYRQLKNKYDAKAHYSAAGDFHQGEMEIIRYRTKSAPMFSQSYFHYILSTIYKGVSQYGQNPLLPVCWIFGGLIFFSILFMYAGLYPTDPQSNLPRFKYCISFENTPSIGTLFNDWKWSLIYTLKLLSFQRESVFTTDSWSGHFGTALFRLYSSSMLAFFLLALRRRFKR